MLSRRRTLYVAAADNGAHIVVFFCSISYKLLDHCAPRNGTFGTLQMLLSREVDVIFGPVCSTGGLLYPYYNTRQ